MDRRKLLQYALDQFGDEPEYLWSKYPTYCVLRCTVSQKWYAAVMEVPRARLELPGGGMVDILDVKCDPILLGSLLGTPGFLQAYHMSKSSWVTILLDGTVPAGTVQELLHISRSLACKPPARKRK